MPRNRLTTPVALIASALAASLATAQTPEATCSKLLPADKLQAAAGKGFKPADARLDKGETMCAWMRRGGDGPFATVSVQHYAKAQTALPLAELYENVLTPHEAAGKKKREPIAGVGKRAAFLAADPQQLVAIERDDAVLRIVMNGMTKAQATAVAKVIATP